MGGVAMAEIWKTVATSLGTAFGIVIGMVQTHVVLSAFATAGMALTVAGGTWPQWGIFVIAAAVVALICVVATAFIGRWDRKE